MPEKFVTPDRQVTIDAFIRLGLTEERLSGNDTIKTELAKKFFSYDTDKKVTGFGPGIYEPETDVDKMKRELEMFFDGRLELFERHG